MNQETETITLKWGTLKGWSLKKTLVWKFFKNMLMLE